MYKFAALLATLAICQFAMAYGCGIVSGPVVGSTYHGGLYGGAVGVGYGPGYVDGVYHGVHGYGCGTIL